MTIMFIKNKSYNSDEWKLFQKYQLYILTKFIELCEQNNLKYHLIFGSLLGCVREGGMIPWDDDIDVGMPYEDYKKLLNIMRDKPAGFEDFEFLTSEESPSKHLTMNFGVFSYTKIKCEMIDKNNERPYIWIDIYPCFRFYTKTHMFIATMLLKSKIYSKYQHKKFCYLLGKTLHTLKLYRFGEFMLNKMKFDIEKPYCYKVDNNLFAIKKIPPMINIKRANFEDIEVNIPENYDEILRELYGDYLIKPAEIDRNKFSMIKNIDFGECNQNHLEKLLKELHRT